MCFMIFQKEKTPFQGIKTKSLKSRKIDNFPKGLVHYFGLKLAIFSPNLFQAILPRKMFFVIFQNEKTPFQALKKKLKKSKNRQFSKGVNPWFWSNIGHFLTLFFQTIQPKKMCFMIFQNAKNTFPAYKNNKFKKLIN